MTSKYYRVSIYKACGFKMRWLSGNNDLFVQLQWDTFKHKSNFMSIRSTPILLQGLGNLGQLLYSLASRHFRKKKKIYLNAKIEELETNNKLKNFRDMYRGINDFKKGYQPRTNIVKNEKGDLVAYSHSILARWRNHFSQLLNIRVVNDRQI
jgi:hypothetical protein